MKIIILYSTENIMFRDLALIKDENVVLSDYYTALSRNNKIIKALRKFCCSNKVNKIVKIPVKHIWSSLNYINWEKNEHYIVLFFGIYNKHLDPKFLMSLKEEYNIEYSLCFFDAFDSPHSWIARFYIENIPMKYVLTFDPSDAQKHNFYYLDSFYSMKELKKNAEIEYDLYYVGRNEGERLHFLEQICCMMNKHNVSSKLRLHGVSQLDQVYKDKIIYNEFIKYDVVLEETMKSNCILEMQLDVQSAATQRYYEAVCYNKKLLTNNKNVVNLPFYNPDYIHVFEKPEDIDWEWVKECIPVDYHYDGRFSPVHLIDKIIELEEEKERKELGKVEAD